MSKIRVVVEVDLGDPVGECVGESLDACNCRSCETDIDDAVDSIVERAIRRYNDGLHPTTRAYEMKGLPC